MDECVLFQFRKPKLQTAWWGQWFSLQIPLTSEHHVWWKAFIRRVSQHDQGCMCLFGEWVAPIIIVLFGKLRRVYTHTHAIKPQDHVQSKEKYWGVGAYGGTDWGSAGFLLTWLRLHLLLWDSVLPLVRMSLLAIMAAEESEDIRFVLISLSSKWVHSSLVRVQLN